MAVIKSIEPRSLVPFTFKDVETEASDILDRARAEAQSVLAEANLQAESLLAAAAGEGRAKGLEQGRAAAEETSLRERGQDFADALAAIESAAQQLQGAREHLRAELTHDSVILAAAIARRVVKRQAAIDPVVLEENLREAMKLIVDRREVRVAVHPSQRATLNDALPKLHLEWPGSIVELIDDASIGAGGCRIFTRDGHVDADLNIQLDRIVGELLPTREAT